MTARRSPVYHCLHHALRIQRAGMDRAQAREAVREIPTQCRRPDECAHTERGCRRVAGDYLADVFRIAAARRPRHP